jgi:hypothetical protein
MEEINKVRNDIRITDTVDLGGNITNEADRAAIPDDRLTVIINEIKVELERMVAVLKSGIMESELDERDTKRDGTYRSLLYLNKGYLHHPDERIRTAAIGVENILDKYGFELVNENYASESGSLEALFKDMKRPEVVAQLEVLPGEPDLMVKLEAEQNEFKDAETEWLDAQSKDIQEVSASEVKRDVLKVINKKLVVYLRAMMQVEPDTYRDLSTKIALLIDQANSLEKRRRNNGKEEDGE